MNLIDKPLSCLLELALLGGLALLFALPLLGITGYYAYFQIQERILPGVLVGNEQLSGQTVVEAAARLHKTWNMEHQIAVGAVSSGELKAWNLPASRLGLSVDAIATAQAAYAVGHDQSIQIEMRQMISSLWNGRHVEPLVVFDAQAARVGLAELAARLSVPATDASFRIEAGKVVPIPPAAGLTLDIDQTIAAIAADPQTVILNGYLHLALKPLPPGLIDVSEEMARAERLLSTTVEISAYDPITDQHFQWVLSSQDLQAWLTVQDGPGGPTVSLAEPQLAGYLDQLSAQLASDQYIASDKYAAEFSQAVWNGRPLRLLLNHHPTRYTVQPGDTLLKLSWRVGIPFWRILNANPGLDPDQLTVGQELVIPSKDDLVPLPPVPNKRIQISIGEQRLRTFENGQLRSEHIISTGIDRSPTQPGIFQVQTHELEAYASVWDLYMPHFIGIYEAWPGFMNGIHGLPTLSNGRRLWANILGRPASFGCIILDLPEAADLYSWAETGVVVEIVP
jgi:LysM repeat protein